MLNNWKHITAPSSADMAIPLALFLPVLLVAWTVVVATYRLTFHPYYNNQSRFYQKVESLHAKYGPVVRITPDEVSLSDPENYSTIYHAPGSFFTAADNREHAKRRAPVNPFFSRKGVLELEPVVQEKAKLLLSKLRKDLDRASETPGGFVELQDLYSAISIDVASDYSFDDCYNTLEKEGYGRDFSDMVLGLLTSFWFFMQFKTIEALALSLPTWISSALSPALKEYNKLVKGVRQNITNVKTQTLSQREISQKRSIFHELLSADPNRTVDDMTDIALSIVVAAAAATSNTLGILSYNVISNPDIYHRLRSELLEAYPDDTQEMKWITLEKLPYLTTVGMSSWMMHRTTSAFPEPDKFDPERWLDPEGSSKQHKYLVAFGKDSRQCIGMPLAYCELYVTVATVFRNFADLEIRGTKSSDLVFNDYFSGYHPATATPLRVARRESK
ncbi:cytochrome P450 [Trichoderma harzianum]|uniref:Cytochrome P450 n=1 Tax=Trichoderma harzianum TaxID=5544 RepID=A0A0F9XFC5_TRIHA|nr:cytochrome P450 [Trichoderma harzianum]